MTDQELKDLVASLAISNKETEKQIKEMLTKAEKDDIRYNKMFEKWDKNEARYNKIFEKIGNIESNIGYHAEQFFQDIFKERLEFGRIKYDEMVPNLKYKDGKNEIEFDICLINGNAIALIEVKHRIHPDFVIKFAEDRIEKFRKYFPIYKDYSAYLGIAGFSFDEEVIHRASNYGIGIIKQVGKGIEINAENLKAY